MVGLRLEAEIFALALALALALPLKALTRAAGFDYFRNRLIDANNRL